MPTARRKQGILPTLRWALRSLPFARGFQSPSATCPLRCKRLRLRQSAVFSAGKRTVDNPYLYSSGACRRSRFCGVQIGRARAYGRDGRIYFRFRFRRRDFGACKTYPRENKFARIGVFFAANILGLTICYVFGTAWFITVYGKNVGSIGVKSALMLCVVPYIVPDLVKLFIAAVLSVRLGIYLR